MSDGLNWRELKGRCIDRAAADAEKIEARASARGAAFTPKERELIDGYRAKLVLRVKKQTDEFWMKEAADGRAVPDIVATLLADIHADYEQKLFNG